MDSSGNPIYEQIKEQAEGAILNGELRADDMLLSIHQLAANLKVSAATTTRAHSEFERKRYIYNPEGKGCLVSPVDSELGGEQMLRKTEGGFNIAIEAAKVAKI